MAEITFTSTSQVYGTSSWGGSQSIVPIGKDNAVRTTASRTGGLTDINNITALSCTLTIISGSPAYIDTLLYVTTSSTVYGNNTVANATYIGKFNPGAVTGSQTVTVSDFQAGAFKTAVGGTTPWYFIWLHDAMTTNQSFVNKTDTLNWSITYTPTSINIRTGSAYKSGDPWVKTGGVWKKGIAYVKVGGVWKQGI